MKKLFALMVSIFAISGLALANESNTSMESAATDSMNQESSMTAGSNDIAIQKAKKGKKAKKAKKAKKHAKKHHEDSAAHGSDAAAAPAAPAAPADAPAAH